MSEPPLLVFVPGWGAQATAWQPVLAVLPPDWERMVVDLPEHGDLRRLAHDVVASLPRPVTLVGHSMGGQVTALVHAARPDLVCSEVVIEPAYGMAESGRAEIVALRAALLRSGHAALDGFLAGAFSGRTRPALRATVMADVRATPVEVLVRYLDDEYLHPYSNGLARPARELLARRVAPVLGVFSTAEAAAFERAAGGEIDLWPGHGHYLHLEDPVRFATRLVRWIAGL